MPTLGFYRKNKMVRIISTQDSLRLLYLTKPFFRDHEQKNLMFERNANKKFYGETLNTENLKKKLVHLWQGVLTFLCYSHLLTIA